MPPGYWSRFLWLLLHGIAVRMDDLTKAGSPFPLSDVAQMLRGFCALLPCPDCQNEFTKMLAEDFRHMTDRWPDAGYFAWTVDARGRIAERLHRPIRTADYCKPVFDIDWYGNAWNALQLMSFAYPLEASADIRRDTDMFFRFLPRVWPGADPSAWTAVIDKQEAAAVADDLTDVPSAGPLPVDGQPVPPVQAAAPAWTKTRERLIIGVYALRSTVQTEPMMKVPDLDTIIIQWSNGLNDYVLAWKKQADEIKAKQAEEAARIAAIESKTTVPIPPTTTTATIGPPPRLLTRQKKSNKSNTTKYRQRSMTTIGSIPTTAGPVPIAVDRNNRPVLTTTTTTIPTAGRYRQKQKPKLPAVAVIDPLPPLLANNAALAVNRSTVPPTPRIRIPAEPNHIIPVAAAADAPGSVVRPTVSPNRRRRRRQPMTTDIVFSSGNRQASKVNGAFVASAVIVIIFAVVCAILFVWLMRPATAAIVLPMAGSADAVITSEVVMAASAPIDTSVLQPIDIAASAPPSSFWSNWFDSRPSATVIRPADSYSDTFFDDLIDADARPWNMAAAPVGFDDPFF